MNDDWLKLCGLLHIEPENIHELSDMLYKLRIDTNGTDYVGWLAISDKTFNSVPIMINLLEVTMSNLETSREVLFELVVDNYHTFKVKQNEDYVIYTSHRIYKVGYDTKETINKLNARLDELGIDHD